jgi:peroxiredoxin
MPEEAWVWYRKAPQVWQAKMLEAPDAIREFYRYIEIRAESDGRVWSDPLPPGKYVIRDNYIMDPDRQDRGQAVRFFVEATRFTIDTDPANEGVPLDLGVIPVLERPDRDAPQRQVGDQAPEFTVTTLDDISFSLEAMRGKVVLLYFWATWHDACHKETPHLAEVWKRHGARADFAMIGLNLDDQYEAAQAFLKEEEIAWPQAFLDGWNNSRISLNYVVVAHELPQVFVIDRDGKIAATNVQGASMLTAVDAALGP